MADPEAPRTVAVKRISDGRFQATNARGGTVEFGSGGDDDFTPVELLLAAIGGCSGIDVDILTSRRAEPERFDVEVSGNKVRDEHGNHLTDLSMTFDVRFGDGEAGDAARKVLPDAVKRSHEWLCTVSRTVALGTPVDVTIRE